MNNYLVFREEGIKSGQAIQHRYEHNERKAKRYNNTNIKEEYIEKNYYFKKPKGNYEDIFKEMVEEGKITTKGLKEDADHFSEMIIGINREYWKDKDPEYIKAFFEAVYKHIETKFGEEMILSAVLHMDEIDKDGFQNIHMHVVAIPTVINKRYYTKRSKEYKELLNEVGKENILVNDERLLKEEERQVSHSKFFESQKDSDHRLVYSYSVWQDEILQALKDAGFSEIHRGKMNQKAVHLHPSAYKNIMEKIKCDADGLIEDVEKKSFDEKHYLVTKETFDNVFKCKEKVETEIVSYNLAVDSLEKEQSKVYERQNKIYQNALRQANLEIQLKEAEVLETEAKRLEEENKQLKTILCILKEKVSVLLNCFKDLINQWILLRNTRTNDTTDLIKEMDQQVRYSINLINENINNEEFNR